MKHATATLSTPLQEKICQAGCLCAVSQSVRDAGAGAVLVDFTHPSVVYEHTRAAIAYGVHPVIGTTGLSPEQLNELTGTHTMHPFALIHIGQPQPKDAR